MQVVPGFEGATTGYHLGPVIGRGGSSEVRLGVQRSTCRVVAVKLLHPDVGGSSAWSRFEAERRALGELSHHAEIVTILDAGTAESGPWLVMEYCSRGSFAGLGPGPVTPEAATAVLGATAAALASAHAVGFRHGDVKPANIMLTDAGAPALADFGLARLTAARTATSSVRGYTPDHVPPEILNGDAGSPAGDVYSLGTTIWELLAGRPPFRGAHDEALAVVMMRIVRDPVPPVPRDDVAPWVVDLVAQMTAKDPAQRPSASDVWSRVAEHMPDPRIWHSVRPVAAASVEGFADGQVARTDSAASTQVWVRRGRGVAEQPPADCTTRRCSAAGRALPRRGWRRWCRANTGARP